ncbi:MAG: division plane positioning ATPase MipZ [Erythrobacter sp.]|uniref:division plane positioning ATPase MipZ n=1 Tax=Erythrobacter sp. TaxID=1042 RepID=UPI00261E72CF|nr:division plane positioning ATPase MipZ [Erythrobacter sp.]MDJ0979556.1 division plane positioning ATPase MipZ [Erythrobacter sp.]
MTQTIATRAAHRIVFANEKGGTGKSTTAVHVGVALAYLGARVTMLDLDPRQRTTFRYLENRVETMKKRSVTLPTPAAEVFSGDSPDALLKSIERLEADSDFLIIDNPGRDDPFARAAVENADTLVTPLNDSFVDFDLIGQVDGDTFEVTKLSFFAELIWESRMRRSRKTLEERRPEMDWIVVRNRTGYVEARNQARLEKALKEMSQRVGFRAVKGLSERVIYRELFPSGLTLLDKGHLGELGTSHLVARQELRALIQALKLPEFEKAQASLELA